MSISSVRETRLVSSPTSLLRTLSKTARNPSEKEVQETCNTYSSTAAPYSESRTGVSVGASRLVYYHVHDAGT
ncbi:hypothetical protein AcV5_007998 [Taiwanofungus camphoratus]|nr:hypothetical protein AcV5_007998 [Antrodia cinnamomea]KAI0930756.1 hypothetical protein AcV7_004853 [Antrodia cinnamomea]